ncbi:MAG: 50S ribosomal protein L9 [Bacteroidetes bacterium]|nr:MAG: 50S ribosomal protein L9 [Bacteroidota bacterium]TAG94303.1 MAG: 50S ribosomal protein L9 [Bacteroidota bacterium]
MEIILKDDITGLGYKNDIVNVKPGYGRNYLIPEGLATLATPSAKKVLTENLKQAAHKAAKIKGDAEAKASKIQDATIEIVARISEAGKIFGAVTTIQLAEALQKQGIDIDRRKIVIDQKDIKFLGDFTATVDLHREVKAVLKFKVVEG